MNRFKRVLAWVVLSGLLSAASASAGEWFDGAAVSPSGDWIAATDDDGNAAMMAFVSTIDTVLIGRKTYDIFAAHWPYVGADDPIGPLFDRVTKYVATRNLNLQLGWQNSQNLGADVADAVRRLKNEEGPDLLTQGSTQLLHTLFKHDLVDEIHLSIFPVVLGAGKRLFVDGISPGALKLVSSRVSGSGVTVNKYVRDGRITTGNFQIEPPTEAELRRRRNLT